MDDLELMCEKILDEILITNEDVCNFINELTQNKFFKPQDPVHWERWLSKRKNQQKFLAQATNCETDMLVLNKEIPWELNHEKALLEEARRYAYVFDKYRGHPNFWLNTEDVHGKTRKNRITAQLYPATVDFKTQKSIARFGYFGTPRKLDEEKGLKGEYRQLNKLNKWNSNPLVQEMKLVHKVNLSEMEPFKPDIDALLVLGKGLLREVSPPKELGPKIIITEPPTEDDQRFGWWKNDINSQSVSPPILKIGGTVVTPASKAGEFIWTFSLNYDDEFNNNNNIKLLTMKNKGTTTVHYNWKKVPPYCNNNFPLKFSLNDEPKFFFDHTDGLILPGNKVTFCFLFKSSLPGTFKEVWQLMTRPAVHTSPLLIILYGLSLHETRNSYLSVEDIDQYIKDCVNKAVSNKEKDKEFHTPDNVMKYDELFTEKEKFEYNNPTMYYHMDEVNLLKTVYFRIKGSAWNYSLRNLYQSIISLSSEEEKEDMLNIYTETYRTLQRPPIYDVVTNSRYSAVYSLLCNFANELETVFLGLEHVFNLQPLPNVEMLYEMESPLLPRKLRSNEIEKVAKSEEVIKKVFRLALMKEKVNKIKLLNGKTYPLKLTTKRKPLKSNKKVDFSNQKTIKKRNNGAESSSEHDSDSFAFSERSTAEIQSSKKFINFIGLKNLQKKIKQKYCKNRKKCRHILIYQCRLLLSSTIDDIAAFLESTKIIEGGVQEVQNPLFATYPFS